MTADDVGDFLELMAAHGIRVWLDGGWCDFTRATGSTRRTGPTSPRSASGSPSPCRATTRDSALGGDPLDHRSHRTRPSPPHAGPRIVSGECPSGSAFSTCRRTTSSLESASNPRPRPKRMKKVVYSITVRRQTEYSWGDMKSRSVFYGWWVVAGFSFMTFISTGIRHAVGPFLKPMVADLDLDRASFLLVIAMS